MIVPFRRSTLLTMIPNGAQGVRPRRMKKSALRVRGRTAHWTSQASGVPTRSDNLQLRRWQRIASAGEPLVTDKFSKYNVQVDAPLYDAETYEKHLTHADWTREETDHLIGVYKECNGKWPVVIDRYTFGQDRTMEDLKARFYSVSATMLSINTPITSMTAPEYNLYETLSNFNPRQETSRKKLAEGHLYRRQNEVDEETVLLGELQRIMLSQANLDSEREELRRRLDHPLASTSSYQYGTSQALTTLWQQFLAQDRLKKTQRLRPTGNPAYDGFTGATPTSAKARDSTAGLPDATNASGRRPTRDSLPSATPQTTLPVDLSKANMVRFGVLQAQDKLPSGVTFASDKLTKPRIAKSTIQTDKIAAILTHIGIPDLIPLPTPAVVDQFDTIMGKVHALLDLRKLAEKEEQELRVRTAE
nr:swr1-complex protein 4 [Quercus suber]